MAPSRGSDNTDSPAASSRDSLDSAADPDLEHISREPSSGFLAARSSQPQFTLRALFLGLLIGVLIAFSNTYFGLQTGWISGMAMPSALIGFAYFKGLRTLMGRLGKEGWGFGEGFSEVENVLVQTVAGSVGTMPLGCGFVGVVPALEYLLKPSETPHSASNDAEIVSALAAAQESGGLRLPLGKLILWALGICFFGVVFAVPLRKEVIVREKLKFPSGTATALMIGVLHGGEKSGSGGEERAEEGQATRRKSNRSVEGGEEAQSLIREGRDAGEHEDEEETDKDGQKDWKKQIKLLTVSFGVSGAYVRMAFLRCIPIYHHLSHRLSIAVLALILILTSSQDPHLVLHPATPQHPLPRPPTRQHLALDPQSLTRLHRPRHHHGPGYNPPHAARRPARLGRSVSRSQAPRLGRRRRWRLGNGLQGLDRVGQSGHHAS